MRSLERKVILSWCFLLSMFSFSTHAQLFATFEIGDAELPEYTTTATALTPFTTITFDGEFASPPNVFVMTPQFAGDPCLIRITNVTETSFDATCLEPQPVAETPADSGLFELVPTIRVNPGTSSFSYIAIADGGVTVPISPPPADPADPTDVVFQSACENISSQQWGNACPGCSGTESLTEITFATAFDNAPAVLAQIQTTNNGSLTTPVGEPEFIGAVFSNNGTTSVTATGFDLAIERMEASAVPLLSAAEEICYLAAEITGCESLDFSSLGGPTTPVMFQALTGLQNIEGQETDGSTTDFETDCFDDTPVALAHHISRGGNDGGFLRLNGLDNEGITLIVDEDTVGDTERNHPGAEQPAIFAFSEDFTTPVTLNSAKVSRFGRNAIFNWETSAETFHLGFNLWGETSDGWVQLNRQLIKGNGVDSSDTQSYRTAIRLSRSQNNEITQFGISSMDNTGYEEFYGPFTEGVAYGEEANNEPVDWTETRNAFNQSMRELGYVKYNNRWFRVNSRIKELVKNFDLGLNRLHFEVRVENSGLHSLSASELITLNPGWENARLSTIALTLNGQAVSRHIISDDDRLNNDDTIVFNAGEVIGADTPFIENYAYRLSIDSTRVIDASSFNGTDLDEQALSETSLISEKVTAKKLHSAGLTTGDPWYDARLLSVGSPASVNYSANFEYPIDAEQDGVLDVLLFGSLDFPGGENDHHVQISVNDQQVSDISFDGLVGYSDKIALPAGLLTDANNTITVTVVGDTGHFADVVLVDEITVSAQSSLMNAERTAFDFSSDEGAEGYRISNNGSDVLDVYAYTNTGLLSTVSTVELDSETGKAVAFAALPFEVSESNPAELRYAVASEWPAPSSIELVEGQDIHSEQADYFIVAHPTFMGDELDDFVQFKTDLGFNVRVVSWLDLVTTYGYGNNTPKALNNFLKAASDLYKIDNVLIVGGHTFDYFGITNENIVNFIPSHYRAVSVFEYTATDNPYADLDGDNVPELAIGRWPVRSVDDLRTIISKTKTWHANREDDQYQSAYLVAQAEDSQSLSFSEQLAARVKFPLSQTPGIDSVEQLNLDQLPDGVTDVVSYTRQALAEQINSGTELISFSGHASPTAWGFQNIINTDFIRGLENQGKPSLLMPLACYITHFEDVSTNTLAHQWMFAGEQGAAAIHGASVLGEYRENGIFAERYLNRAKQATTVGQAILEAKQELGSNNEILHNWTLLGDPALPIR